MTTVMLPLTVAFAGAIGAVARWGTVTLVLAWGFRATVATLAVNVLGSFLAGFLFGTLRGAHPLLCAAVFLGFLGAFTTFSTYTLETLRLAVSGDFLHALLNLLLQNLLGLSAAALGLWLASFAGR